MIKIENNYQYNELRKKILSGNVTSIWHGNKFFKGSRSFPILNFNYITSNLTDFEKNIFSEIENKKMSYHLNGYGVNYNESLVSYIGESSERYAFVSSYNLIKDYIIISSYSQLIEKYGQDKVCDLDFLNIYFNPENNEYYVNEDDELQWIEMNSLVHLGEKVIMPLQFVINQIGNGYKNEKKFTTSAVSTGTACHETIYKSLENAVIEYLQIDSFNLWWYGGVKGKDIDIDLLKFANKYFKNEDKVKKFIENFDVKFTDVSYDKGIDIIVCEIFSKKDDLPKYTIGVQGGKGLDGVLYRGFMECLAVLEYNMNFPWLDEKKYKSITKNTRNINNLDDNITLYAKYGKPKSIKHNYNFYENYNYKKNYNVIDSIKKFSKYAGFLTITLPEFEGMNLEVLRVVVPELLTICLPSYIPTFHPRYNKIGGIKNYEPHPLA